VNRSLVLIPVVAVLLTGCSAPADLGSAKPADTIDNCGFTVDLDTNPQRIITIKSTSTELVLALGLGDRIIGQAFPDGPIDPSLGDVDVPLISDFVPSEEAVLELEPDFIVAGWESNLTADGAGDRDELKSLGIGTYVSPAACKEAPYKPTKLTFDDIFDYILEAGDVLGAPANAAELVQEQKDALAGIEPSTEGLSALWWSSGEDSPYVGAGIGAPELVMETVGLRNIAADVDDTWSTLSWEAIVDANPDVIILVDASWNTAASKRAMLESNPATAALPAVVNHRYIEIPFATSEAGVRTVAAAGLIAQGLAALTP
jgi:iron complex transport system substrate-binding protein